MTPFPKVVVLGCGNPSRGDDALGPALMERLEAWMRLHPDRPVEAVEDFQFQVEHALDLQDQDLALFLDSAASGPNPYAFRMIIPAAGASVSTHALSPPVLLEAFLRLDFGAPPPAFSLGVRGHVFELGEELSPQAKGNLEEAWALLEGLLESPSQNAWEDACTLG